MHATVATSCVSADVSDVSMPQADQVSGGQIGAVLVVNPNRRNPRIGTVVEQHHQWCAMLGQRAHGLERGPAGCVVPGGNDDAIGGAHAHLLERAHLGIDGAGVDDIDVVATALRGQAHTLGELDEVGAAQSPDEQGDDV